MSKDFNDWIKEEVFRNPALALVDEELLRAAFKGGVDFTTARVLEDYNRPRKTETGE